MEGSCDLVTQGLISVAASAVVLLSRMNKGERARIPLAGPWRLGARDGYYPQYHSLKEVFGKHRARLQALWPGDGGWGQK